MPKYYQILIVFFVLTVAPTLLALDIPKRPQGYVSDYAAMLSDQTRARLENTLALYERQTTNQILVVTFPRLEGESLEDFSIHLSEAWKPGQKDKDNGVIFLIFKEDRKMRIEVGYGLEGVLPDALAGRIIQQVVVPYFKKGDFESGILSGVQAILQVTGKEFQAQHQPFSQGARRELTPEELEALRAKGRAMGIFVLIAVLLFFIADYFRYHRYRREHRLNQNRYSFWEWWFRFAVLLAVLSILFRVAFYMMLFSRGGAYGSRSGFSGFSGGGGGSFGGGGASGSW